MSSVTRAAISDIQTLKRKLQSERTMKEEYHSHINDLVSKYDNHDTCNVNISFEIDCKVKMSSLAETVVKMRQTNVKVTFVVYSLITLTYLGPRQQHCAR
jgi:hypothetical protein